MQVLLRTTGAALQLYLMEQPRPFQQSNWLG